MKKFLLITFALSLVVLTACTTKETITNDGSVTSETTANKTSTEKVIEPTNDLLDGHHLYINTEHKFSLQYPEERSMQEGQYNSVVRFFSPQDFEDTFREDIAVFVTDMDKQSLKEYLQNVEETLRKTVANFGMIQETNVKIDGKKSPKWIYQWKQVGRDMKWAQVFVEKGANLYLISYTASQTTFEEHEGVLETVLDTFNFVK